MPPLAERSDERIAGGAGSGPDPGPGLYAVSYDPW
jgi:hypothetical protein